MPISTIGLGTAATAATDVRVAVDLVAKSNVTLSGEQTIDGVLTSSSLVLCIGQTDAAENGIYQTDSGAWTRAGTLQTDAELADWVSLGIEAYVGAGGAYYGQSRRFRLRISNSPTTLDTDDIEWEVVPGRYKLYSQTLADSTTTQIDVINIPAIPGANLTIQATGASAKASAGSTLGRVYLGDSSAIDTTAGNYYQLNEYLFGSGSVATETVNDSPYIVFPAQDSARAGSCVVTIMNYSLADFHTHIFAAQNSHHNTSFANPIWQAFTGIIGVWEDASIVERVRISLADALTVGSRVVISVEVQP